MFKNMVSVLVVSILLINCTSAKKEKEESQVKEITMKTLSKESIKVQDYIQKDIVIAHRGTLIGRQKKRRLHFYGQEILERII